MASETCAGCFGTGYVDGIKCTFCGGTGRIWVPDKVDYSSNTPLGKGNYNRGPSWFDNAFEDNLAELSFLAVWGLIIYKGFKNPETNWYMTIAIGFIAGFVAYKLLKGPLRPIGTLLKYAFYLGILGIAVYGIYQIIVLFQD
ncbi:hypothetical protein [Aestuariivivens sediminis]|uniref:hypothetical protein n=1 Tax=Aestuariivivens sediminis TaxID=2913557 RepID=UPI001F591FF2|nr:hypothetical protein [Aestuariivivens sediminis]